jgi:hypothetical protein
LQYDCFVTAEDAITVELVFWGMVCVDGRKKFLI